MLCQQDVCHMFQKVLFYSQIWWPAICLRCHWWTVCLGVPDDVVLANVTNNYSSSSNDSTPRLWASNEMAEAKARQCNTTRGMYLTICYIYLLVFEINIYTKWKMGKNCHAHCSDLIMHHEVNVRQCNTIRGLFLTVCYLHLLVFGRICYDEVWLIHVKSWTRAGPPYIYLFWSFISQFVFHTRIYGLSTSNLSGSVDFMIHIGIISICFTWGLLLFWFDTWVLLFFH